MRVSFCLPNSLLALLALILPPTFQHEIRRLDNSEYGNLSPRDAEICHKLKTQMPASLRKMSFDDPGQMFHLSDWHFNDIDSGQSSNGSSEYYLDLPFLLHGISSQNSDFFKPLSRLLNPRAASGFSCPANTNSCASIGADYGCCPQGTTCQLDSRGSLGCCPNSAGKCTGNTPTNCGQGYTACSLSPGGGGCCAQGFQCQSQGCVGVSTTVVVVYPTITVSSSSSSITTTTITTTSTSSSTPPRTTTSTSTSQSPTTTIIESATTPLVPVLPTSLSTTTSTTTQPTTAFLGPCPTGYYACSAVFNAGSCCQVGRDCGRTSCPPLITSTALVSNGVTIADVSASGVCATGWSTCGAGVGGGCCPTGYACGTQLCSATASAQATLGGTVAKEASSGAATARITEGGRLVGVYAMVVAVVVLVTKI